MKRAIVLLGLAAFLIAFEVVARAVGLADHASVVAGMPVSNASYALGPLAIAVHLLAVVIAPILALAGALEAGAARRV